MDIHSPGEKMSREEYMCIAAWPVGAVPERGVSIAYPSNFSLSEKMFRKARLGSILPSPQKSIFGARHLLSRNNEKTSDWLASKRKCRTHIVSHAPVPRANVSTVDSKIQYVPAHRSDFPPTLTYILVS